MFVAFYIIIFFVKLCYFKHIKLNKLSNYINIVFVLYVLILGYIEYNNNAEH